MQLTVGLKNVSINGQKKEIDVPPVIMNNRTMVPLRLVGEGLGASFEWNEQEKTVVYKSGEKEVTLCIDKPIIGFDTPPTIVEGRTMVPLRYISEVFGANVMWFPSTQSVSVNR